MRLMEAWKEFKDSILPWVLAGGFLWFNNWTEQRDKTELALALKQQAQAVDGVKDLLSKQGYISTPADPIPIKGTRK